MASLAPHLRTALAVVFFATQGVLIATAAGRPDHAFGFQMFGESSTIDARLSREVVQGGRTVRLPAPGGQWTARDSHGVAHPFSWYDRIRSRRVVRLDGPHFASYGAAAQLQRLEAALDDVAAHTLSASADAETRALVLTATVRRNGAAPTTVTLTRSRP